MIGYPGLASCMAEVHAHWGQVRGTAGKGEGEEDQNALPLQQHPLAMIVNWRAKM